MLYACESGSRAWGFPSADSDYDVRFLYIHKADWYLRVDIAQQRDVIEKPISDELDISGWELRKALNLLKKSNPALIEWINSPIVYKKDDVFHSRIKGLLNEYCSPKACFHHYSQMAKGNFREYLKGYIVRVKKYFYVLRPILAMRWVERELGVVPTEFDILLDTVVDDKELVAEVKRLIEQKREGLESKDMPRIPVISDFIESELERFEISEFDPPVSGTSFDSMNQVFLDTLWD